MPFSLSGLFSGVSSAVNQDLKAATSVASDALSAITHPASIENAIVQNISNATTSTETALAGAARSALNTVSNLISSRPVTPANKLAANVIGSSPISVPPIQKYSTTQEFNTDLLTSPDGSPANINLIGAAPGVSPADASYTWYMPKVTAASAGSSSILNPQSNSGDGTSAMTNLSSTLPMDPKSISSPDLQGLIIKALKNPAVSAGLGALGGAAAATAGVKLLGGKKSTKHHKRRKHAYKHHKRS